MKKYLLNISEEELLNLGFEFDIAQRMFFNNLSKGNITRDSVREKMVFIDDDTCKSEMTIGNTGHGFNEKRNKGVFFSLVEANKINTLDRYDFRHKKYPRIEVKIYRRNDKFGLKNLVILENYSQFPNELMEEILKYSVSEITKVELFEEYNLASDKSNETFEVEDFERMYDLCYLLNIPMNNSGVKYWMKIINIVMNYETMRNIGHITEKEFYHALDLNDPEFYPEKQFKQFMVIYKWFKSDFELLDAQREDYLHKKAKQLEEARKLMEEDLF